MDEFGPGSLLSGIDSAQEAQAVLSPPDFSDRRAVGRRLRDLVGTPPAEEILARLTPLLLRELAEAANPDRALINLERLTQAVSSRADLAAALAADPHGLQMLVTIFAGSQFLTDILLRRPEQYASLIQPGVLAQVKSPFQYYVEAYRAACGRPQAADCTGAVDALRRYQHWELLRIGAADLTGLLDLTTVTAQLSQLADSMIAVTLDVLARRLGAPAAGFVVLGMGKLGGGELNYSSDIDLIFLAEEDAAACQRLGERLIAALAGASDEGFLYRVDMRLRPWGRVGPLISTVGGYLAYLERHARLWEKQALLRARVIAGDDAVGRAFLRRAEPLLFEAGAEAVRAEVYAMKQRTEADLRRNGRSWGEVKLGEGSIRDAEFVVQYLQLAHGGAHPALRTGNTPEALARLAEGGFLSADDCRILSEGYTFLRTVEHYLQILDYRQTHSLPSNPADLRYLARRLGFQGEDAGDRFVLRYQQHSAAVRAVYQRHLAPVADDGAPTQRGVEPMQPPADPDPTANDRFEIDRHLARLAPSYAAAFSPREIAQHARMAARLGDRNPVEVATEQLGADRWRVTVVAYDYLGELSLICGLLSSYGLSISDGNVFTYEPSGASDTRDSADGGRPMADGREQPRSPFRDPRRKIVDVFTVRFVAADAAVAAPAADMGALWRCYETDLAALLRLLEGRRQREAQGEMAKRVALAVQNSPDAAPTLQPIDIAIDNDASDRYTALRIQAPDTAGFLYEFTNALALGGVHIAQVSVATEGNRVRDILFVTDARGEKITAPERQRELRATAVLVKHFTHLLPHSPNPQAALLHFNEYLGELFARPSWPDELASLERPEVLAALARLLGVSEFLWDDFLRMQYANLFPVVEDVGALNAPKAKGQLAAELAAALKSTADGADERREVSSSAIAPRLAWPSAPEGAPGDDWRERLNAFKDREMFRIDMRHILGHMPTFGHFAEELTDLAEVVVGTATACCAGELTAQFGQPLDERGAPARLSICALGKCGGRELGFASDIELMFIFDGGGETAGPRVISAAEYFEKLVIEFVRSIRARREGIFEIDLQLRPYGKAGSLAVSLDSYRRYFAVGGAAWSYERQALVKLRPIAGDAGLGREIGALRDACVYSGAAFDVAAMRAMRERQLRHLVTPGALNAKFSQGGLVDVEYIVQGLQITHGAGDPSLRVTNTAAAIAALTRAGVIAAGDGARLGAALLFLQQLINALRMVRGNNRDLTVPPEGSEEFAFLARRLGYGIEPARLGAAITDHMTWVGRSGARLLG